MAFADGSPRVVEAAGTRGKLTLAGTVSAGDLIGYSSGWVRADGSPTIIPRFIAGVDGISGDVIEVFTAAYVTGFTGGTNGAAVYLSDTAGGYSDSAGTLELWVGKMMSATTALVSPWSEKFMGTIQMPLGNWRCISSNDIPVKGAADGGVISKDTTPIFERVNGATDKALRLRWAASDSAEITFGPILAPSDYDDTKPVLLHFLAAMAGASNTPVLTVAFFEGVGDTDAGGATAAVTGTSVAEYTVSIAAADVGEHPKMWSVGVTPGAHTTDALYCYGAWLEYYKR